jgi:hypothetical protein
MESHSKPSYTIICCLQETENELLHELDFLQSSEHNDDELLLFQLPPLLPVAAPAGSQPASSDGGAGPSNGGARPASLRQLPSSKLGKLLVFESGRVKMQVR